MTTTTPYIINLRNEPLGDNIYVGRATPRRGLPHTIWGNPWKVDAIHPAGTCVEEYRKWLIGESSHPAIEGCRTAILANIPDLAAQLLAGKKLACWCHPKPCHAEVLVELVEQHLGRKLP